VSERAETSEDRRSEWTEVGICAGYATVQKVEFPQRALPSKGEICAGYATVQRWDLRSVRYRPKVEFVQGTLPLEGG
jgi:hypothetical protein